MSWNRVVGRVIRLRLDNQDIVVWFPAETRGFIISKAFTQALGLTHTPIQLVLGAFTPMVKQPRHEAGHSHSSSTKVKNMWCYTSTLSLLWTTVK